MTSIDRSLIALDKLLTLISPKHKKQAEIEIADIRKTLQNYDKILSTSTIVPLRPKKIY